MHILQELHEKSLQCNVHPVETIQEPYETSFA
jgi:hypothetical protein